MVATDTKLGNVSSDNSVCHDQSMTASSDTDIKLSDKNRKLYSDSDEPLSSYVKPLCSSTQVIDKEEKKSKKRKLLSDSDESLSMVAGNGENKKNKMDVSVKVDRSDNSSKESDVEDDEKLSSDSDKPKRKKLVKRKNNSDSHSSSESESDNETHSNGIRPQNEAFDSPNKIRNNCNSNSSDSEPSNGKDNNNTEKSSSDTSIHDSPEKKVKGMDESSIKNQGSSHNISSSDSSDDKLLLKISTKKQVKKNVKNTKSKTSFATLKGKSSVHTLKPYDSPSDSSDSDDDRKQGNTSRMRHKKDPLTHYKKLMRAMDLRVSNYGKFLKGCKSVAAKKSKMLTHMQDHGLRGKPTITRCKKIAAKNRIKNEVAELDTENIISDTGRGRRQNVHSLYSTQTPIKKSRISFMGGDSSSDGDEPIKNNLKNDSDTEKLKDNVKDENNDSENENVKSDIEESKGSSDKNNGSDSEKDSGKGYKNNDSDSDDSVLKRKSTNTKNKNDIKSGSNSESDNEMLKSKITTENNCDYKNPTVALEKLLDAKYENSDSDQ